MALSITINKVAVAESFATGATVATAVASGGTTYAYSLATGSDKFSISSTGVVTVIANMNNSNISSFSVKVVSGAEEITSEVTYPNIQAKDQSKFSKPNMIYKITKDIDLNNCILTIPAGCTLDFHGGSIINGTLILNNTLIIQQDIENHITATINGTYKEGQVLYDSVLKKMKLWNGTAWVNMDGTALT